MVNYNPHQQFSPAFGKDPVQTVEHLTYANMTLPRLFYEAHNNILEMEIFIMPCVANCREARVLGRRQPPQSKDLHTLPLCSSVFPMDFCSDSMCYFSIICVITSFMTF